MSKLHDQILVPADTSKLSELRAHLYALCEKNRVPSQTTRRMVLAVDEALANVIEHGLVEKEDISVDLEINRDQIVATIRDRGIPFDPTPQSKSPDHTRFPKRGFGLYLIQLIVDGMEYQRTSSGENVLVLTKVIENESSP